MHFNTWETAFAFRKTSEATKVCDFDIHSAIPELSFFSDKETLKPNRYLSDCLNRSFVFIYISPSYYFHVIIIILTTIYPTISSRLPDASLDIQIIFTIRKSNNIFILIQLRRLQRLVG